MATTLDNLDGSFSVTFTAEEQDTLAGLPSGQLDAYVTLWLEERGKTVLRERFAKLTTEERAAVMVTLKSKDAVKG